MKSPSFFKQFVPKTPLRPYVEALWVLDTPVDFRALGASPRIFPKGVTELVFPFRGDMRFKHADGSELKIVTAGIAGPQLRPHYMQLNGRVGLLGVKFTLAGARALLALPLTELINDKTDLKDFVGQSALDCAEQIAEAPDTASRLNIIERYLMQWLDLNRGIEKPLKAALQYLTTTPIERISELDEPVPLSSRQLQRKFKAEVGYTPKTLSRFLRFRQAVARIKSGRYAHLSDVAFDTGYYDQAHFTREFKRFAEVTPSQYVAQLRQLKV